MLKVSIWEQQSLLSQPDFLIVGAGITGMYTAYFLRQKFPDADILVLERGSFSSGASTKNAGFACFGTVSELLDDFARFGPEVTMETVQMRWSGLQLCKQILGEENIEYVESGGYEVFSFEDQEFMASCLERLDNINEAVGNLIGKDHVYQFHKGAPYGCKNIVGHIFNTFEGQINTGKMYKALLDLCQSLSIRFLFGFEVNELIYGDLPGVVNPQYGRIQAKRLIITNNGFARQFFPDMDVNTVRNQVVVTSPIKNLRIKGCYNMNQGYFYFRNIGERILFGGGRHLLGASEMTELFDSTQEAMELLHSMIVQHIEITQPFEIDYHWSGILGVGQSKKPIIQSVDAHIYAGVRMGGMGVAISSEVGRLLSELVHDNY